MSRNVMPSLTSQLCGDSLPAVCVAGEATRTPMDARQASEYEASVKVDR